MNQITMIVIMRIFNNNGTLINFKSFGLHPIIIWEFSHVVSYPSGRIIRHFGFFLSAAADFKAAAIALPQDPPQSKPSSLMSLRESEKDSSSSVFIYLSTKLLSNTSGKKSYPIPSTR